MLRRRTTFRVGRLVLVLIALTAFVGDLFVIDAARWADLAQSRLANQARPNSLSRETLKRPSAAQEVVEILEQRWSNPLSWHAGAIEARAMAEAALGDEATSPNVRFAHYLAARDWTLNANASNPVAPEGWIRLQALANHGVPGLDCKSDKCVSASYQASPLTNAPDFECLRYKMSNRRVTTKIVETALLSSGINDETLATCLSALGPDEVYAMILKKHQFERRAVAY